VARVAQGTGRWTRLGIAAQVLVVVLLSGAAAALATWLAGRPGLRLRLDVTATGRNTLDPALAGIVERLPEPVTIEVFFRPMREPLRAPAGEAQQRMAELLFVASNQFPGQLRVVQHDLRDVAAAAQRLQELEVQEDNVVVVTCGTNRKVLRLFRDLARLDPGNAMMKVPPRLEGFRGGEALGEALLEVSRGERPRILFAHGHGERDPYDSEVGGLAELRSALSADGFEVAWWEPGEDPQVPDDCDVLAIVDPRQPYTREELEAIAVWVEGGGRLLVAPSRSDDVLDGPGSAGELLRRFGIVVERGFAAQLRRNALGQFVDGIKECAILFLPTEGLSPRHPVTEPLHRLGYALQNLPGARAFRRGTAREDGRIDALVETPRESWLDLPDAQGKHDWVFTPDRGERAGPLAVAMAVEFPPPGADLTGGADQARPWARVLALGSAEGMGNGPFPFARDLLLNGFNWLAERDWRLNVRPRDQDVRQLDLVNTGALAVVNRVAFLALPGLFALLGVLVALMRRR
jgi:hypothetical protein